MPNVHYYGKNRLFAKYGHECDLIEENGEDGEVQKKSLYQKIKNYFIERCIISELHVLSSEMLRSQGAIMKEKLRHVAYYHYTIHPFSDVRKWWECFMTLVFIVQFTLQPLLTAFCTDTKFQKVIPIHEWEIVVIFTETAVIVDIALNFVTGYYEKVNKEVVLKVSSISMHYLKTWFLPHVIGSIPTHLGMMILSGTLKHEHSYEKNDILIKVLSLLKVIRVITFRSYLMQIFMNYNISYVNRLILLLFACIVFFFHYLTCVMVFLSDYARIFVHPTVFMLTPKNLTPLQKYASNMYHTAQIICGSGYPMPIINNQFSYIFMLLIMFGSRILFIHWLSRVTEIHQARSSSSDKYNLMVRQLREYMTHKQLPEYMQRRLLTYYEFRFQKSYFRESEILTTLSGQLRQEILMHSCRELVENVEFFKHLPLALIIRIVSCLKSQVFLINDVIVRAFTQGDCMFFIGIGTVAIYTASGHEICHLEDGDHFGEIALVMQDELRVASVVAVEVCELYRLDRNDFIKAIQPYPDLLDEIMRIAADRMEQTVVLDEYNRREMASRRLY